MMKPSEDSREDKSITMAEVVSVVKMFPGGRRLRVDKICSEMLKGKSGSGCCGTVMVDMPLECHMEGWDNACGVTVFLK